MKMHLRESRTSKFSGGACPRTPPRVEAPLGLRQIYPPVTLKYPLVQKLIETPAIPIFISRSTLTYGALYYGKIETQTSYMYT